MTTNFNWTEELDKSQLLDPAQRNRKMIDLMRKEIDFQTANLRDLRAQNDRLQREMEALEQRIVENREQTKQSESGRLAAERFLSAKGIA